MYLKGSRYSYNNRRKSSNPLRIALLAIIAAAGIYFSVVIVPDTQPLFIPTATPTTPPEAFVFEAEQFVNDGKMARAIESYYKAIDSNPKDISVYVNLAKLEMYEGHTEDALLNAENAILLNGSNPVAHAIRGWALGKLGNYLDAEAAFKRAGEIDPANPLLYAYMTESYVNEFTEKESLATLEKATDASRKAIEFGSSTMEAHRARGLLLEITGNYNEAINEFQIAISINPNIAELYLALGRNLRAADQTTEAITAFERARSLNPYDPWAPYYISRTYSGNGEYAKAIQQAEDAIDLRPDYTLFYWNLGTQYYMSGKYNDAVKYFRLAIYGGITPSGAEIEAIPISYNSRIPELFSMYGLVMARSGNCSEATEIVRMITQNIPDDAIAMSNAQAMTDRCKSSDFDIVLAAPVDGGGSLPTVGPTMSEEGNPDGETTPSEDSGAIDDSGIPTDGTDGSPVNG